MSQLQDIFRWVRKKQDKSVATAMTEALQTADARATRLIALSLLERKDRNGCVKLIERMPDLPADIQEHLVEQGPHLTEALGKATRATTGLGRQHAIQIVVTAGIVRSAGLLAGALTDPRSRVGDQAADGLLTLAQLQTAAPSSRGGQDRSVREREVLRRSIFDAVQRYDRHRRKPVLLALCVLIDAGLLNGSCLLSCTSKVGMRDLGMMLGRAEHDQVNRLLVPLLAIPDLKNACCEGIALAVERGSLGPILEKGHLLLDPRTRTALAGTPDPHALWPRDAVIDGLSSREVRGVVYWADSLPWFAAVRVQKLTGLEGVSDPTVRLGALRRLMGVEDDQGFAAVSRYCHDSDPRIARIAARHLVRHHWQGLEELSRTLVNSRHLALREIAGEYLGPTGFTKLWTSWPVLDMERRMLLGRALIKIDTRFHIHLAQKISSRDKGARLRAMAIIRCLGQGEWFDRSLQLLSVDPDRKLAASAVSALASAGGDLALGAIRGALGHSDNRVRANAIEAMQERGEAMDRDRLKGMADHEANRPRANAIAALMPDDPPAAIAALKKMLSDPHAPHRHSALWVVNILGTTEVTAQIAEMAVSDPDRAVRDRAGRVVDKMIELMGSSRVEAAAA